MNTFLITIVKTGADVPGSWFQALIDWSEERFTNIDIVLERGDEESNLHLHLVGTCRCPLNKGSTDLLAKKIREAFGIHRSTGSRTKLKIDHLEKTRDRENATRYLAKQHGSTWFKFHSTNKTDEDWARLKAEYGESLGTNYERGKKMLRQDQVFLYSYKCAANNYPVLTNAGSLDWVVWGIQSREVALHPGFLKPISGNVNETKAAIFSKLMHNPETCTQR